MEVTDESPDKVLDTRQVRRRDELQIPHFVRDDKPLRDDNPLREDKFISGGQIDLRNFIGVSSSD